MLGASIEALGHPMEMLAVVDRSVDPLLPGGRELLNFTDAVLLGSAEELMMARTAVIDRLGWDEMVDAAGVIGNFEMMNRIADATGMPVGTGARRARAELIERLGLDRFDHVAAH
jgi:hypothetical protein